LLRVVAALLQTETINADIAFMAAAKESDSIPQAYRQEIFYALAADLAEAIAHYRRQTERSDRPRGLAASEWLDVIEPEWRSKLPISTGAAAAAKLVNGLMETASIGLCSDRSVGCERLLQRRNDIWSPAVRLGLDGLVKGTLLHHLGGRFERVRAHPASLFARYASGELAMFEPPAESDDDWRVRPSRGNRVISGVPFSTPVTVELRRDGKPVCQTVWSKGEAVRGEMAIFAADPLSDVVGDELTFIGSESGHFKPKFVFVVVPPTWDLSGETGESLVQRLDELLEDGRTLWRVHGTAIARSPESDAFRIISDGASSRRDELHLEGAAPKYFQSEDPEVDLFCGAPLIRVAEGARVREPQQGEVMWRPGGERQWRALPLGVGRVDIAWMDAKAKFIHDRRRLFILPADADLDCSRDRNGMVYNPVGFDVSALSSADENLEIERRDNAVFARFVGQTFRRAKLALRVGLGRPLVISARFSMGSGIATWSGVRIAGGKSVFSAAKISLAELAECVAFADGHQALSVRLLDREGRAIKGAVAYWPFDDELPLRSAADELSSMMALFGNIDVSAELSLQDGSAFWHVRQFEMSLDDRSGQLATTMGFARDDVVDLFGRPVDAPWQEQRLAQWTFAERIDRRLPPISDDIQGVWIVYGRRGETIVSRPKLMAFAAKMEVAPGLPQAAMIADHYERDAALRQRFELISADAPETDADVRWLVDLCAELRGLPPACFDALLTLAAYPVVAARIALHAGIAQLRAVLSIADGLPFAWFLIPFEAWRVAAEIERRNCRARLLAAFAAADVDKWADRAVADAVKAIAAIEPLLAWPLLAATGACADMMPARHALLDAAQDHIRRYGDQVPESASKESLFRQLFPEQMPPEFDRFDAMHLDALDAPCAAALVAARGLPIKLDLIRRIKLFAHADSTYFSEAFSERFKELLK
jgi:hypothetical protein